MNFDSNLGEIKQSTEPRSIEEDNGIRYDSDLARIEELIKGTTFTREEIARLMEILNSRADMEENKSFKNAIENAQQVPWRLEILKTPSEGKQQYIERSAIGGCREQSVVPAGVGASPIDIARAYMATGRNTEEGQDLHNFISNSERAHPTNEFARNPLLLPSPSPKPSICWPGSVVLDRHGHTTTTSRRARNRLHNFPRTPYSRMSKSVTKLQADSEYASTSTPLQQSQTSLYGQENLRGETVDAYGSVGPIRRIRNKFASEVRPRGSIFPSTPKEIPPKVPTTQVFGGFLPSAEKNLVPGETSGVSKYRSGDSVSRPSDRGMSSTNISSSQAARRALELLDRNKPTPKQKEAELKLATAWGSSPDATDVSNVENRSSAYVEEPVPKASGQKSSKFNFLDNFHGKGIDEARDASTGIAKASGSIFTNSSNNMSGADAMPIFGLKGTSDPEAKNCNKNTLATANHGQTETSSQFSLPPLSNGRNSKIPTEAAEAMKNHGTKRSLPSISINRPELRAASSDSGRGFTFPVSASAGVLSEPPTPSMMPSSSASIMSQPIGTPSYSFGTKKSAPSVVFSFPSSTTNSASNHDDSDIKYSFGSEKKTRLCFSSFDKDAVCF